MNNFHAFDPDQQSKNWEMLNEYEDRKAAEAAIIRTKVALEEREARIQEKEKELSLGESNLLARQNSISLEATDFSLDSLKNDQAICSPWSCLTSNVIVNSKYSTVADYCKIPSVKYLTNTDLRIEFNQLTNLWRQIDPLGRKDKTLSDLKTDLFVVGVVNEKAVCVFALIWTNNKLWPYVVPYNEFMSGNVTKKMPFISRYPGISRELLNIVFYESIKSCPHNLFFTIPEKCGWLKIDGNLRFVSDETVFSNLKEYYPSSVTKRKMLPTTKEINECALNLKSSIRNQIATSIMTTINISSLLLTLFENENLHLDKAFVIEAKSEEAKNTVIAFTKNQNYESLVTANLYDSPSKINSNLLDVNDGTVVFSDNSINENTNRRLTSFSLISNDINLNNGIEHNTNKAVIVITGNTGAIPSNAPAFYIADNSVSVNENYGKIQQAVGEFSYSFLRNLVRNPDLRNNLITEAITFAYNKINNNDSNAAIIMSATAYILHHYNVLDENDVQNIITWLEDDAENIPDSDNIIADDFGNVLSNIICSGKAELVNQFEEPYYTPGTNKIMLDEKKHLNFDYKFINHIIMPKMNSIKRRNILLDTLSRKNLLNSTKSYKRDLKYSVSSYENQTGSFYSVGTDVLSEQARAIVNAFGFRNLFRKKDELPVNLIPIISDNYDGFAGVKKDPDLDENFHTYFSGKSRFGKSYAVVQQALYRAEMGEKVIIVDQSQAFSHSELLKHQSAEVIDKYFDYWDIPSMGIPVDFADFSSCSTLPQKKSNLLSILTSGMKVSGDFQEKILQKAISSMLKKWEKKDKHSLNDILDEFDHKDESGRKLKAKLESVLALLTNIGFSETNWEDFLINKKNIVVISAGKDEIHNITTLIDMMLADFYTYKIANPEFKCTLVLDEIEDLYLSPNGPVNIILRKGGKHNLAMFLSSQEYSSEKDCLGKIIGNCGTLLFFRPKDDNLKEIAKFTGCPLNELSSFEPGECIVCGNIYDYRKARNSYQVIRGKTATFNVAPKNKIARFYLS